MALWLIPAFWAGSLTACGLLVACYLRRRRAAERGLTPSDRELLRGHVSFYASLEPELARRFERDVSIFLEEHRISGVDEVEITREVELLVAASAVRLIFRRPAWEYPDFGEILVYPGAFSMDGTYSTSVRDGHPHAAGQVHSQGGVIISLPHLMRSFEHDNDGFNVGYHEFAHVLDGLPSADGIPDRLSLGAYLPWIRVMQEEFEKVHRGGSVLRSYAGTSPAEFFACAVEAFFEKPEQVHARAPELYRQLADFFNQDPVLERRTEERP